MKNRNKFSRDMRVVLKVGAWAEVTGVVTKISADSSVLSVRLDTAPKMTLGYHPSEVDSTGDDLVFLRRQAD